MYLVKISFPCLKLRVILKSYQNYGKLLILAIDSGSNLLYCNINSLGLELFLIEYTKTTG